MGDAAVESKVDFGDKHHKICLISAVLSIIFFSGQSGFNTALIAVSDVGDPIVNFLLCLWQTLEGPIMCMASILMVYGLYFAKSIFIVKWCIYAISCIIVYTILSVWELLITSGEISFFPKLGLPYYFRRLDIIGVVFRIFMVVSIIFNYSLYKKMKNR